MVDPINVNDAVAHLQVLLANGDLDGATHYLRSLHPADSAQLLTWLEPEQQAALVDRLQAPELAEVFAQMDEADMAEVAQHLDVEDLADVLDQMEPDAAADLISELEPADAAEVLEQMDEAGTIARLLAYDPETAGGIMNLPPPSLRRQMTIADAFAFIKKHYRDASDIFYLYVLDRYERLIGVVNLRALILAEPSQTVEEIMDREVVTATVDMDQEAVAQIFAHYDLLAVPVVDADNKLVGIISVDDAVDVIEDEATEDIYRLAQVGEEAAIFSPIHRAVRHRQPWLIVNMGTAFLASIVVSMFDNTLAQAAWLAAFMPIVAGQGGNAGTQTLTIVVRSLALGEIGVSDAASVLWHELRVGLANGFTIGLLVGLFSWLWRGNPFLGLAIGLAMLGNMIIAATVGVFIPMLLKRLRVDPALASSVFVTAFTDSCGFALFLGLCTLLLNWLR
jgi:magnesium transporter